jgi:hypothetical protein
VTNAFDALNRLPATPQETAWLQARMETLSVRESLILGAAGTGYIGKEQGQRFTNMVME